MPIQIATPARKIVARTQMPLESLLGTWLPFANPPVDSENHGPWANFEIRLLSRYSLRNPFKSAIHIDMKNVIQRKFTLAARPVGMPKESDFALVEVPLPAPAEGEIAVKSLYLSVDPYMRGRMNDVKSYAPPVAIGGTMVGGVVGEVIASNNPRFAVGDIVQGEFGWQDHTISNGKGVRKVDPTIAPISTALGVLGMPGLTAYFGLLEIGQPKAGETVVVSGAA
jgi:NADPH-dependent curcumin reductase CurA